MAIFHIGLTEIEHVMSQAHAMNRLASYDNFELLDGRFRYRSLIVRNAPNGNSECIFGEHEFNNLIRASWERTNKEPAFIPCGEVIFKNLVTLGNAALPIQVADGVALIGAPVNWGKDYARWYVSQHMPQADNFSWDDGNLTFSLDIDLHSIAHEPTPGILLASPGHEIYGHWILDYAPRLFLTQLMDPILQQTLYFGGIPRWANFFLDAFFVKQSTIRIMPKRLLTYFPEVGMPSGTKQGFRIAQPINGIAWKAVKRYAESLTATSPCPIPDGKKSKIFISRKTWGSSREIINSARLEEIAKNRGYITICPEDFDIPTQAKIMRRSNIIVGEDGSGLHNIIFSEPGTVLGVISTPDRINLWHVGICRAMEHRLSYLGAELRTDGTRFVDESDYVRFLDQLEAESLR